jgi:hypothetical protein
MDEKPCDLYRKENMAITMSYFSVGVVSSFIATPLNVYLVEIIGAEPAMQSTIAILHHLPWSSKILFGFMSDACPIYGMHRKPYLAIGALLFSGSYVLYSCVEKNNITLLSTCIFIGTLGLIVLDVMADTMCVQRSRYESEIEKGQMQSTCYSIRFGGSVLGAIVGAVLCNKSTWGWGLSYFQSSFVCGMIPFLLVSPWIFKFFILLFFFNNQVLIRIILHLV